MMSSITFKSAPGKVTECKHSSPPLTRFIVKLKGDGRNLIPDRYRGSAHGNANKPNTHFCCKLPSLHKHVALSR